MTKLNVLIEKDYLFSIFPVANITTTISNDEVCKAKRVFLTTRGFNSFVSEVEEMFDLQVK